jgi:hypothetical protein
MIVLYHLHTDKVVNTTLSPTLAYVSRIGLVPSTSRLSSHMYDSFILDSYRIKSSIRSHKGKLTDLLYIDRQLIGEQLNILEVLPASRRPYDIPRAICLG